MVALKFPGKWSHPEIRKDVVALWHTQTKLHLGVTAIHLILVWGT